MEILAALLLLYLGYCFGVFVVIRVVPALLYLSGRFLGLCLFETGKLLLRAGWWTLGTALPLAWAAGRSAVLFAMIFWDEWNHGDDAAADGDQDEDHDHQDEDDHDQHDRLFEDALTLLGLTPGFSQEDLKRAYKRAIVKAHPDVGGSAAQAAAVNVARDLIEQQRGWA